MAMNHQRTPRLKPLLDTGPPGFMVDTPWLKGQGIDPKSIHGHVAHCWLDRVVRDICRRPLPKVAKIGAKESWVVPLPSLQWLLNHPVHLGRERALDMFGHIHDLSIWGKAARPLPWRPVMPRAPSPPPSCCLRSPPRSMCTRINFLPSSGSTLRPGTSFQPGALHSSSPAWYWMKLALMGRRRLHHHFFARTPTERRS